MLVPSIAKPLQLDLSSSDRAGAVASKAASVCPDAARGDACRTRAQQWSDGADGNSLADPSDDRDHPPR